MQRISFLSSPCELYCQVGETEVFGDFHFGLRVCQQLRYIVSSLYLAWGQLPFIFISSTCPIYMRTWFTRDLINDIFPNV